MAKAHAAKDRPAFSGEPLRDIPVPQAGFLKDDEFGAAVLAEYHDRVRTEFNNHPDLRIFKTAAGIVHGSNPFAAVLLDTIVRPDYRIATPADLQAVLDGERRGSGPNLRGCYKDTALVLRTIGEPNGYIGQRLSKQIGLHEELPLVVCLTGLDLVMDDNSPNGLSFRTTGNSIYFHAPILMEKSDHFDNRHVDRKAGLPTRFGGSERYYYGMQEGLTRLYVGRGWSIDSIWDELANSQPDGRIVFIENDVPPHKLAKYTAYLDAACKFLNSADEENPRRTRSRR